MMPPVFKATLTQNELSQSNVPEISSWNEADSSSSRTIEHPLGRLILLGHSGADDRTLERATDRAFRHDDLAPLTSLPGSYSAILLGEGKLTALTDPVGQIPLYYAADGQRATVGTQPSIVTQNARLIPELLNVAASLAIPGANAKLFWNSSSLQGVHKLSGGNIARVTASGIHTESYDAFLPKFNSLDEAATDLRSTLTAALNSRLELGPVSSDLSGVDSSTLAFLLTHLNANQLNTFFFRRSDASNGDRHYVEEYVRLNDAFRLHEFISDRGLTTFTMEDFLGAPRTEDLAYAIHASPNGWKFLKAYFDFIHSHNDGAAHLTGGGGDAVLGVHSAYLADVLKSGSVTRFLRESWDFARLQTASPLKLMAHMASQAYTDPRIALLNVAERLRKPEQTSKFQLMHSAERWPINTVGTAWLTSKMRHRLADFLHSNASELIPPEHMGVGDVRALEALYASSQSATMLKYYAKHSGVDIHSPYLDNDVVKAIFSAPAYLRGDPHKFKKILGMAFEGVLPDEVLQRKSKGAYDEEVCQAIVRSSAVYAQVLSDSRLADTGIIEPQKVREALDRIDVQPMKTIWALDRIMSVEGWLRNLDSNHSAATAASQKNRPIAISRSNSSVSVSDSTQSVGKARLTVPDHVHAISSNTGSLILYNRQTDMYHPLDSPRSNILRAIAATGDIEAATERITAVHPQTDPALIRSDIVRCLEKFRKIGVVQPTRSSHTRPLPERAGRIRLDANEIKMASDSVSDIDTRLHERIAVTVAFILDKIIAQAVPKARLPLLRVIQKNWAKREATPEEAERLLHAAHAIPYLGRVACNEAPYAAALAAAMLKRKVAWHLGASFGPRIFHAWIETEDKPIRSRREGRVAGRFQSFFDSL